MSEEELDCMIRVKYILDSLPKEGLTPEYANISKQVDIYLHKNCKHQLEKDYIDLNPEKTLIVLYCTKCNYTFH